MQREIEILAGKTDLEAERDQDTFNSNVVVFEGKPIQSPRKTDSVTKEN